MKYFSTSSKINILRISHVIRDVHMQFYALNHVSFLLSFLFACANYTSLFVSRDPTAPENVFFE